MNITWLSIMMLARAMQSSAETVAWSPRVHFSRTSIIVALIVAFATTCQQLQLAGAT
jgi:hypothetical protein